MFLKKFDQLCTYKNKFLNSLLCGFCKPHTLFILLQTQQKELDQCGFLGTMLMNLSKAYNCFTHDLLIAKLETFGLDMANLSLLRNYVTSDKQRTKFGSCYSDWFEFIREILQGIPQFFNISIHDIFFEVQIVIFVIKIKYFKIKHL